MMISLKNIVYFDHPFFVKNEPLQTASAQPDSEGQRFIYITVWIPMSNVVRSHSNAQ